MESELYRGLWKEKIFELLACPERYVEKIRERKKRLQNRIGAFSQVALYGAGNVGQRTVSFLEENGLRVPIKYFVVSDVKQNEKTIKGIPVVDILSLENKKENLLLILTVGEDYMEEVKENIEKLGFPHCIVWKELWE